MLRIFRFATWPEGFENEGRALRLRKKKTGSFRPLVPMGVDSNGICKGTERYSLDAYQDFGLEHAVTLTQRESDLIALSNPGVKPPLALEALHPWLPVSRYVGDARKQYERLEALLRRYGKHLFAADDFCNRNWNTVCNALRMSSSLDARFYGAWHLPLQDAYVLEEARADRRVIAIDFNAMYAACMQHAFPAPGDLRLVRYDREVRPGEALPTGLFRCQLGGTISSFMRKYLPFRMFFSGRYLGVAADEDIEVDLNEFEVEFYRRHFSRVHVKDAVVADSVVAHPLARKARSAYARRLNGKAQGNKVLADLEKFSIILLASCSNRPGRKSVEHPGLDEALERLEGSHGIRPYPGEPDAAVLGWLSGGKRVSVFPRAKGTRVVAPELVGGSACFSLGQRIVARGRTLLLEWMERLESLASDLNICYCNIDSIHFSVSKDQADRVLEYLTMNASEAMGGFKIEAVAEHGLWLEPGRYWLYSDTVQKFSNQGVGDGIQPFKERKIFVTSRQVDGLHIPMRVGLDMADTMSDAQEAIEQDGLMRLRGTQIKAGMNYEEILGRLERNRRETLPLKLAAFKRLKTRFSVPV